MSTGKELFRIGDRNFTKFIKMPSYTVNSQPVYEEWQDGNGNYHRNVIRNRISGSFDLFFSNNQDYYDFLDTLKDSGAYNSYVLASFYVNNLHEVYVGFFFISIEPANTEPIMSSNHDTFSVTIEEY